MTTTRRFTVHDIGRLAGVSAMTVSRALNQPERVSPETLKRVLEAVKQTGFVPNAMARGLRSSKARLVAALLPTLVGPVFQETVKSLDHTLVQHGYQLMIGQTGYDQGREDALLDAVIRRRPDGIVLVGIQHTEEGRRLLLASGIPVVETWDLTPAPLDMLVGFSHEAIGEAVMGYLHARGHRHIALVTADDPRAHTRARGFERCGERLGLAQPVHKVFSSAPSTLGAGRAALARLLEEQPAVSALFCSSDTLALGVLIEAQTRGIEVPRQLAVVGLGDQEFAADLQPALTTVRIDGTRIGRCAAELLIRRADAQPVDEPVIDIGFSIVERASA